MRLSSRRLIAFTLALAISSARSESDDVAGKVTLTAPKIMFSSCEKPHWPTESLAREETGMVILALRVAADGHVKETVLLRSSGHALLDNSAMEALSRCKFTPGTIAGQPNELWSDMIYQWSLETANGNDRALEQVHLDTGRGVVEAMFIAAMSGGDNNGKRASPSERIALLTGAAEGGHAVAQYMLAEMFNQGRNMTQDEKKAKFWYGKAAEQGHIVAIERLRLQWPSH